MKYIPVWLVLVALLSACGGARQIADETVQNPYVKQAKTLAEVGIMAMRREHWDYATNVFERALKQAQLADDLPLVVKQWYNLGTAHAAAKQYRQAMHDFSEAQAIARRAGDSSGLVRARLAWMLLPIRIGTKQEQGNIWQPDVLAVSYPVDVHLAAARLAQKQQRQHVAKQEYDLVLKQGGSSRSGLLYRGQAHLGLAMLARDQWDKTRAKREVEESIVLLKKVGSPRLLAHALLFYGKLELARSALQRALVIYQRLEDSRGQWDCLTALVEIENHVGDTLAAKAYQQRLKSLQEGLD